MEFEQKIVSTSNASSIYVWIEDQFVRQPAHACFCDECRVLDAHDKESLRLCRAYLDGELPLDKWWDEFVRHDITHKEFPLSKYFDSGPASLATAVDFLVYEQQDRCDGKTFSEDELKLQLSGLLYGYEIRQRTVHLWKVTHRPESENH